MPGTTPVYGFPYPLGSDPVRDGDNDIRALAEDVETVLDTQMGLVKVAAVSFTADPNPFVNGCFSSLFQNYRVMISVTGSDLGTSLAFRMRTGTTPETGAVYDRFGLNFTTSGTVQNRETPNMTAGNELSNALIGNQPTCIAADIYNPNVAVNTTVDSRALGAALGGVNLLSYRVETLTQYTGFELLPNSGTLTGSIRIYGYRN